MANEKSAAEMFQDFRTPEGKKKLAEQAKRTKALRAKMLKLRGTK